VVQQNTLSTAEIEAAKAAYLARGGQVTRCKTVNLGSTSLRARGIRVN
jgi:DTW domain-containing protein YfiP